MSIHRRILGTAITMAAAVVLSKGSPEERPTYEVWRVRTPITVDGHLVEDAWQKAPSVGPFVNNADGSPSSFRTEAKLLYDDEFLYFAFWIEDENIWATMTERNQHLWEEEVVEVFLKGDPKHPSYIELEVNPLGTLLDIFLIDVRKPIPYGSWNSQRIQWAVQVDGTVDGNLGDRGWTCEIALPLEEVITAPSLPPRPGDRWSLNLYRIQRRPEPASLAWSPTLKRDFHVPARFGLIVFSDRSVP